MALSSPANVCRLFDRADQFPFQHTQDLPQIVATLQDASVHPNHGVLPLPQPQLRPLFDLVHRVFCRASEDREYGNITEMRHAIVAPFTSGDHTSIKAKNQGQFSAMKSDLFGRMEL